MCCTPRPSGIPGEKFLDYVSIHCAAASAHQQRRYVLTHGGDEHHEESGQDTGKAERENDRPKASPGGGAEIGRHLDQLGLYALQSGANGQCREGDPYIDKRNDDSSAAVEETAYGLGNDPQIYEKTVDRSFGAEQKLPTHHPEQETGPERNEQQHQAKPGSAPGTEYEKVGNRKRQGRGDHS